MFTVTSTFGGLEAMITGLCDEFPKTLGKHREMFVLALLGGIFLCCLPTCTYVNIAWATLCMVGNEFLQFLMGSEGR